MKREERRSFSDISRWMLYSVSITNILSSVCYFLAFYKRGIRVLTFLSFQDRIEIKVLFVLLSVSLVHGCSSFIIYGVEMFEKMKFTQWMLRNDRRELSEVKVFCARMILGVTAGVIAYFLTDLRLVFSLTGVFFSTSICMIISGVVTFSRMADVRPKDSFWKKLMDGLSVIFGVLAILLFIIERFDSTFI